MAYRTDCRLVDVKFALNILRNSGLLGIEGEQWFLTDEGIEAAPKAPLTSRPRRLVQATSRHPIAVAATSAVVGALCLKLIEYLFGPVKP